MEATAIVTVLALLQFIFFGVQVGAARGKAGIKAPATTGDPDYERKFRVHQNTMEQLVVFIPALWLYANFVNGFWGAGFGLVYIVGRFVYRASYIKAPASRGTGFMLTFLPSAVMLIWVLVKSGLAYL